MPLLPPLYTHAEYERTCTRGQEIKDRQISAESLLLRIVIMSCRQTVFEAAGCNEGLRRLARAWHKRVMADDVVAHAFSHGFHPQHVERLAAYWAEALCGPNT